MSTFKYGDLEILIERLASKGLWTEYGMRIHAPNHPEYAVRAWKVGGSPDKLVAEVLVYDLVKAHTRPNDYLLELVAPHIPIDLGSKQDALDFIRIADHLKDFLYDADRGVWAAWELKPMNRPEDFERGPREWIPKGKE